MTQNFKKDGELGQSAEISKKLEKIKQNRAVLDATLAWATSEIGTAIIGILIWCLFMGIACFALFTFDSLN